MKIKNIFFGFSPIIAAVPVVASVSYAAKPSEINSKEVVGQIQKSDFNIRGYEENANGVLSLIGDFQKVGYLKDINLNDLANKIGGESIMLNKLVEVVSSFNGSLYLRAINWAGWAGVAISAATLIYTILTNS